ncbi:DNA topoisomerase 2-like isoform X2 [Lotus japonicus]|uniref:DNA topoisomerase 2-like isoform X2 n=1 Tax=Lotus japonicus TaxID=34305 RepID=UPI00258C05F0|nr:DNA topoisomerase 2-like isoform X2 [Lotus japonicus]
MSSVVTTNEPAAAEGSSHTTKAASHVFQAFQYLLKLCSHPLLVVDRKILDSIPGLFPELFPAGSDANLELGNLRHSPKLDALFEILKKSGIGVDASGSEAAVSVGQHKVLIFAQHKAFLDIIEKCLFQTHMKNVKYLRLDGSNEPETHFKIVQDFNSDPNINVLLLTTHVGGFGLNLTSADTLVFVEHDRNPMRDHQDYDGSHIKGLLINFFYMLSPSLLRIPYFLSELITPIIRAFHCNGIQKLSFYSYPEYEKWWKNWGNSDWRIKYYKGLGSFTPEEGKEFFQNVEIQRKYFVWRNDEDLDAINIAFSKSKTRERRGLRLKFKSSDYRDYTDLSICYKDFLQKEFILYSMASVRRCIPSLIDGQKPSQRKILYGAFKRELFTEIRVDKLIGYVAEHSAYHHDESSLATTLMRMARDYVGSMNINLLMANGQFGTRNQGGKDHASPRYIYTELNPISRFLFPEIDIKLLKYLNEDGISVEPEWYLPIIPLVLVNGVSGIATGWNCSIPCYNPKDIIANIKCFLNDDKLQPMVPWYKGFKGTIDKSIEEGYVVSGKVEVIDDQSFRITELPVSTWTKKYEKFLKDHPLIEAFWQNGDNSMVDIKVKLKLETKMTEKELLVEFKLISKIPRSRMYLFNRNARIQKYDSPEQILQEFCKYRLECYDMRTAPSVRQLKDQVRFISEVVFNMIVLSKNMSKAELVLKLKGNGFKPLSQKGENVGGAKNYEHLLPMCTLTFESLKKLQAEKEKELDNLMRADLWAYKKKI